MIPLEIFRRKRGDHGSVSAKLNLIGSLKAGEVPAVTNIAGPRVVAGMFVSGKNRDSGHHQQGANREQS